MKVRLVKIIGILLLVTGVFQYIFPIYYEVLQGYSGLVGFGLIFIGISLLNFRKDQIK